MRPLPIVSMAGTPEVHARADRYSRRFADLWAAEDDLREALHWNSHGRYSHGLFSDKTEAPVETFHLRERVSALIEELIAERAEIVKLSGGTVKP